MILKTGLQLKMSLTDLIPGVKGYTLTPCHSGPGDADTLANFDNPDDNNKLTSVFIKHCFIASR